MGRVGSCFDNAAAEAFFSTDAATVAQAGSHRSTTKTPPSPEQRHKEPSTISGEPQAEDWLCLWVPVLADAASWYVPPDPRDVIDADAPGVSLS